MPGKFHGEQQEGILRWLVENWIPHGPPVAILEGFPGCGKSQLAREVANQVERAVGPVEPPEESEDRARELFLELAVILEQHSLPELAHAFDVGRGARFDKALL